MPVYEVRRRTVLAVATVTAANETEARFLARDVWQQDAAIAALAADVTRQRYEPDDGYDARDEQRYDGSTDTEDDRARRWQEGAVSDSEALEPW